MFILVFLIYVLLAAYEFIPLYKEKKWVEFVLGAALWLASLLIAMLLCFNVEIPSPAEPIKKLMNSVFRVDKL